MGAITECIAKLQVKLCDAAGSRPRAVGWRGCRNETDPETTHTRYGSVMPLLTEEEFDPRLASVRLLGWEIAQLASMEAVRTAEEILTRETDDGQGLRMLANMVKGVSFQSTRFEQALQLLKKLLQGIREEMPRA